MARTFGYGPRDAPDGPIRADTEVFELGAWRWHWPSLVELQHKSECIEWVALEAPVGSSGRWQAIPATERGLTLDRGARRTRRLSQLAPGPLLELLTRAAVDQAEAAAAFAVHGQAGGFALQAGPLLAELDCHGKGGQSGLPIV